MTKTEGKTVSTPSWNCAFDPDGLREVIRTVLQEVLDAEMEEALGG